MYSGLKFLPLNSDRFSTKMQSQKANNYHLHHFIFNKENSEKALYLRSSSTLQLVYR